MALMTVFVLLLLLLQQRTHNSAEACTDGDVSLMLTDGQSRAGYPQVCVNETLQFVCVSSWNKKLAGVFCSLLNFSILFSNVNIPQKFSTTTFTDRLKCNGLETRLSQCRKTNVQYNQCDHLPVARLRCGGISACTNGAVRLGIGDIVEVCSLGRWRKLDGTNWTNTEASVVCRQLLPSKTEFTNAAQKVRLHRRFKVLRVACNGNENFIRDCKVMYPSKSKWNAAAVKCTDGSVDITAAYAPNPSRSSILMTTTASASRTFTVEAVTVTGIVFICIIIAIGSVVSIKLLLKHRHQLPVSRDMEMVNIHLDSNDYVRSKDNGVRSVTVSHSLLVDMSSELLIPSTQLRLLDVIGQGEFGVVYKSHMFQGNSDQPKIVAIKTLKGTFNDDDVDDLIKECIQMKEFEHQNVMNLLGVCLDAGPAPYMVLKYMENGSLLSYLKNNRNTLILDGGVSHDEITVVQAKLLSMCLQIARGMEYLAANKFVHRDLATRNCMIDQTGVIKVADFGLSKGTYDKLYFRQDKNDTVKLPIKWMAIESIEDGVFSEKTDVWSFGVTCWEVFSGGKVPYGGLAPLSVPQLLAEGDRLLKPHNVVCSEEIYQLVMVNCWSALPDSRPSFSKLAIDIDNMATSLAGYFDFAAVGSPLLSPTTTYFK